jgi:hypothetical protein
MAANLLRRPHTSEPSSPPLPQSSALVSAADQGVSGAILSLMVDQMRDMRRENRQLREDVRSLNSLHKRAEHRIEEIQEENRLNMERILGLLATQQATASLHYRIPQTPFSQPIDPISLLSRSETALPPRVRAITHILPFLADYDLMTKGPVVIDDLTCAPSTRACLVL